MRENVDFVAFKPSMDSLWKFTIAGKAKMLSELYDETLDIIEMIFEITHGFFLPTYINCYMSIEPKQIPANVVFEIEPIDKFDRSIKSDRGISFQEFKEDIQSIKTFKGAIKQLRRIQLKGKTKFILERKDEYIDENSKGLYAYPGSEKVLSLQQVLDSPHPDNPLLIAIQRSLSKGEGQRVKESDPAYYQIFFFTYTDIWFEKTEIGLANRNRLRSVFRNIYNNFDVVDASFTTDGISEKDLENVVFGQD